MFAGTAPTLCRNCLSAPDSARARRCPACGSPRLISHPELHELAIAHIDCDAFYASVEKRDDPSLLNRPVIIGGGSRGVVAAACYVARVYGVRSAMPMFRALELCPEAVVLRSDMAKYAAAGRQVRALMLKFTPLVEPLSIDEAFLDLSESAAEHGSAARALAKLVLEIEGTVGVSASIGLSYNKFLAKTASDLDKPRGFAVIGRADAETFLAPRPVGMIYGVGRSLQARLRRDGIVTIGDLRTLDEPTLVCRYGAIGGRLFRFARGIDRRKVNPTGQTKSISSETTFQQDVGDPAALARALFPLCEAVARRLRRKGLAGRRVTLKLKTADFRLLSRSRVVKAPIDDADSLYAAAVALLEKEAVGSPFRLIGAGLEDLIALSEADSADLLAGAGHPTASR